MKHYTYTARETSGATTRGSLEAVDRASALAQLKARGLLPISVEEGKASAPSGAATFGIKRAASIALTVAALGLGVVLAVRLTPRPQPKKQPAPLQKRAAPSVAKAQPAETVKVEKPAALPKPAEQPKIVAPAPAVAAPAEFPAVTLPKTNALAMRLSTKTPRVLVPGLKRADTNAPNPYLTFKTKSERVMSQMLLAKPGEPMLGLGFGRDFDKDFIKALDNTIEIYPTDTPEEVAHKENVAWMKEEMRKLVAQGQTPEEILTAYREQHNEVVKFRTDLQRQLSALKAEGKTKEAEEFVQEANKLLAPYGTRPLALYPTLPQKK